MAQVRNKCQPWGAGLPNMQVGQGIPASPCPAAALAVSHRRGTKSFLKLQLWCILCNNSGGVETVCSERGIGPLRHHVGILNELSRFGDWVQHIIHVPFIPTMDLVFQINLHGSDHLPLCICLWVPKTVLAEKGHAWVLPGEDSKQVINSYRIFIVLLQLYTVTWKSLLFTCEYLYCLGVQVTAEGCWYWQRDSGSVVKETW